MNTHKSALDKLIGSTSSHWPTLTPKARAELASLRATVAQLQIDYAALELAHDALERGNAEQARQLEQARKIIGKINARIYIKAEMQSEVDAWLAANAHAQSSTLQRECKCVIREKPQFPCGAKCWHFNPDGGVACLNCNNTGVQIDAPQASPAQAMIDERMWDE